jgi:tryptophan synthase beta chain
MKFEIDDKGYYGAFGGAFVPEMLYQNISSLKEAYKTIVPGSAFQAELNKLLHDYVGRPTPLYHADRLSRRYGVDILLKREDLNHTGAHKINNTIGQILLARYMGKQEIIAETGAGQHGVATATVCALMGMQCTVYMGAKDVERQAANVHRMKMLGAVVVPVHSGSCTLKDATNEAIRAWIRRPEDTYYLIGSVVGPDPYPDMVAGFQSIISREIREQLQQLRGNALPDAVIACIGGGSNAAGAFYHFINEPSVRLIGVEAAGKGLDSGYTAATMVKGSPGIIHGSKTLLMQTPDGQITEPYSISAGLDYPGVGPLHTHLMSTGRAQYSSATDEEALQAAFRLARLEGIIPALESAHALALLEKENFAAGATVVVCLSGRGDKDLSTYIKNDHIENT